MSRFKPLDSKLEDKNIDAFLMKATSENPNIYYLSHYKSSDPYFLLRTTEKTIIAVTSFEKKRAEEESTADQVLSIQELQDNSKSAVKGLIEEYNIENIGIPEESSIKLYQELEEQIETNVLENPTIKLRRKKTSREITNIEKAQRATENAMKTAENMLEKAEIDEGKLILDGEELTSEKIRNSIHKTLIDHECRHADTIVASGSETIDPHVTGTGPIKPGETIIVDIFPQHKSHYNGDMTRTFVKGEPGEKIEEQHRHVKEAQEAAFKVLEQGAGTSIEEVENAVCSKFKELGHKTYREEGEEGFIHSVGHGVGLEVHEQPRLAGKGVLEAGNVITIEPGLYYQDIGGVRIEDLVVIEEDGYRNLNSMDKNLVI